MEPRWAVLEELPEAVPLLLHTSASVEAAVEEPSRPTLEWEVRLCLSLSPLFSPSRSFLILFLLAGGGGGAKPSGGGGAPAGGIPGQSAYFGVSGGAAGGATSAYFAPK